LGFLLAEWEELIDAWQLESWEAYRDVRRLGRKTRLPEKQRAALWSIFESLRAALQAQGLISRAGMFTRLAAELAGRKHPPFDFVVVDESQDLSPAQLRFLAAIGKSDGTDRPNGLFFAGDLGQRIFQQPFSWKSLGVDIRGRARTLHTNYRTSHQIRSQADRLLAPEVADVDGNTEERRGTVSVFNGPAPVIRTFESEEAEIAAAADWIASRHEEGVAPHEIGVFVRSDAQLPRARAAVERAGLPFKVLDEHVETAHGQVSVATMRLAKGLEFRTVAVLACDDEVIPLQSRIESVTDDSDLAEVYDTERHLLYVACTRARDHLLVSGVEPASEFLSDLSGR
jgi:superfamily I DNA/RNA helicase